MIHVLAEAARSIKNAAAEINKGKELKKIFTDGKKEIKIQINRYQNALMRRVSIVTVTERTAKA